MYIYIFVRFEHAKQYKSLRKTKSHKLKKEKNKRKT